MTQNEPKKSALSNGAPLTIDDLARITGKHFDNLEANMATRHDLGAAVEDLKSAITSAREHTEEEIKTFLHPHLRSLDTVLVDMEHLKNRMEKVEKKLGIAE